MTDLRIKIIADHYGFDHQLRKLTEEMAELTVAIHHYLDRKDDESKASLCEEFADVEIMIDQIRYLMPQRFDLWRHEARDYKLARQMNRIIKKDK